MSRLSATHITVIVCAVIGAIVTLSLFGRETASLTGLLIAIAAGIGLTVGQNNDIKSNVNGNVTRILELTEGMAHRAIEEAKAAPPRAIEPPPHL